MHVGIPLTITKNCGSNFLRVCSFVIEIFEVFRSFYYSTISSTLRDEPPVAFYDNPFRAHQGGHLTVAFYDNPFHTRTKEDT